MPFTEDLTPFFNIDEFASSAMLDGVGISGIFDKDYAEAIGNDVEGYGPTFLCAEIDVPNVAQGQSLLVDGFTYKVRGVEPRTGTVLLRLERQ